MYTYIEKILIFPMTDIFSLTESGVLQITILNLRTPEILVIPR